MCRRNELLGAALMALGAGLLLSLLITKSCVIVLLGGTLLIGGMLLGRRCC